MKIDVMNINSRSKEGYDNFVVSVIVVVPCDCDPIVMLLIMLLLPWDCNEKITYIRYTYEHS